MDSKADIAVRPPEFGETALPYPPALRAWGVLALFCLASIISVIDRGILTLVVEPVRSDLAISDLQISLLQGLSFDRKSVVEGKTVLVLVVLLGLGIINKKTYKILHTRIDHV